LLGRLSSLLWLLFSEHWTFTGAAHGWLLLAKALFIVAVLGFGMAVLLGQLVVKRIS
jgi:hypothetical protein